MKTIPVRKLASQYTELRDPGQFSIRKIETVSGGKDIVHALHRHDFFLVLVLGKGAGTHEIDFIAYPVRDRSVFILRPGQVHRLELKASSTGFIIEFDPAFYPTPNTGMHPRWKNASGNNCCRPAPEAFKKMEAVLDGIREEFEHQEEGYADAIKAGLDLFLITYSRHCGQQPPGAKPANQYSRQRFGELLDLLENNFRTKKKASHYAALMRLSLYQLNAITKIAAGKPVSVLIHERLILEANRYLLATPNQVKDIADQLGFEDVSYFIRFFRKHTGLSPDAFRKKNSG